MNKTKKMGLASLVGSALMLPAVATADPIDLSIEYNDSEIVDPLDFNFSNLNDAAGDVNLTFEARGDLGDGYHYHSYYCGNYYCGYTHYTDTPSPYHTGNSAEYIEVFTDGDSQGLWLDGSYNNDTIGGNDYGRYNYNHVGSLTLSAGYFNSAITGDGEFAVTYDYSPSVNLHYSIDWARVTLQYDSVSVPEPGTLFLLGGGLLGLAYNRRKKKGLG